MVVLLKVLSYLPFPVLYALSDVIYLVIFYLVGYRKKVVYKNLNNAFPEKSEQEIDQIARKYYRHFCDLSLETIKMHRLPPNKIGKYIQFRNTEELNEIFDQGKGVILLCAHYNNWEWNSSLAQVVKHTIKMIYSPMKSNPSMDQYTLKMREQYGCEGTPMAGAPRVGLSINRGPAYGMLWLAADQTPPANSQYWTSFLNQETPFFAGPQKIALKTNSPVYYHYVHKVKRGKYIGQFFKMTDTPAEDGEHQLLLDYADILERIIQEQPEYWLWSHRRWKHKRKPEQTLIPRNKEKKFDQTITDMLEELRQVKSL